MTLNYKSLASEWGCSVRTAKRRVRQFKIKPVEFDGLQPLFRESDCARVANKLRDQRLKKLGFNRGGKAIGRMSRGGAR